MIDANGLQAPTKGLRQTQDGKSMYGMIWCGMVWYGNERGMESSSFLGLPHFLMWLLN